MDGAIVVAAGETDLTLIPYLLFFSHIYLAVILQLSDRKDLR